MRKRARVAILMMLLVLAFHPQVGDGACVTQLGMTCTNTSTGPNCSISAGAICKYEWACGCAGGSWGDCDPDRVYCGPDEQIP